MNWYQLHLEKSSSHRMVLRLPGDELFAMVKAFNEKSIFLISLPANSKKLVDFSGAI
uniref:Uncharacterized protein n=1 Tax=Klebsiella pneumoniae TaxID=573 RepID=A0A8B0SVR3_KLEPN|nr:hypothetical protein [Klebsiella pneumoniae]